jgi:hypothetical protein
MLIQEIPSYLQYIEVIIGYLSYVMPILSWLVATVYPVVMGIGTLMRDVVVGVLPLLPQHPTLYILMSVLVIVGAAIINARNPDSIED